MPLAFCASCSPHHLPGFSAKARWAVSTVAVVAATSAMSGPACHGRTKRSPECLSSRRWRLVQRSLTFLTSEFETVLMRTYTHIYMYVKVTPTNMINIYNSGWLIHNIYVCTVCVCVYLHVISLNNVLCRKCSEVSSLSWRWNANQLITERKWLLTEGEMKGEWHSAAVFAAMWPQNLSTSDLPSTCFMKTNWIVI